MGSWDWGVGRKSKEKSRREKERKRAQSRNRYPNFTNTPGHANKLTPVPPQRGGGQSARQSPWGFSTGDLESICRACHRVEGSQGQAVINVGWLASRPRRRPFLEPPSTRSRDPLRRRALPELPPLRRQVAHLLRATSRYEFVLSRPEPGFAPFSF